MNWVRSDISLDVWSQRRSATLGTLSWLEPMELDSQENDLADLLSMDESYILFLLTLALHRRYDCCFANYLGSGAHLVILLNFDGSR